MDAPISSILSFESFLLFKQLVVGPNGWPIFLKDGFFGGWILEFS